MGSSRTWMAWSAASALAALVQRVEAQQTVTFANVTLVDIDPGCEAAVDGFPALARPVEPSGIVFFLALLLAYTLWSLAFVVERILLPAVQVGIAETVRLPEGLAGPALLALGGCSVPLFFMNLFSLTQDPPTATGLGVTLGSAAFNLLLVLPVCAGVGRWDLPAQLFWWPLVRDLSFYATGLVLTGLFWYFWADRWDADVEERAEHCWSGQESSCCYQRIGGTVPELNPVQYGVLNWWEGFTLWLLFALYALVMRFRHRVKWAVNWVFKFILCCDWGLADKEMIRKEAISQERDRHADREAKLTKEMRRSKIRKRLKYVVTAKKGDDEDTVKQASLLQILASTTLGVSPAVYRSSAILVLRYSGGASGAFETLSGTDASEDGSLSVEKLKDFVILHQNEILGDDIESLSKTEVDELCQKVASDTAGEIRSGTSSLSMGDFKKWYTKAEAKLVREMNNAFDLLDEGSTGEVSVAKIEPVLQLLGCQPSKQVVRKTRDKLEIYNGGKISRSEFDEWYRACMAWSTKVKGTAFASLRRIDDASTPYEKTSSGRRSIRRNPRASRRGIEKPTSNLFDLWGREFGTAELPGVYVWDIEEDAGYLEKFWHVLGFPLRLSVVLLTVFWTGPAEELDVYASLWWVMMAFALIAAFSFIILFASESIGLTLGIPNSALGVTVLAFGVNMPHFFSSVLRALKISNEADSAAKAYNIVRSLEHSIKGNLFDLLVGLPFAWMISCAAKGRPVRIGASNVGPSFMMLALMTVLLLVLWTSARWKLLKLVSAVMLCLYILFLLQDLLLADWIRPVPNFIYCSDCRSEMICASV